MEPAHVLNQVETLFSGLRTHITSIEYSIVIRNDILILSVPIDLEAGDMIVIPPSLITTEAPSRRYIQGCIEKCWPQLVVYLS